jgi:hypothetical protein
MNRALAIFLMSCGTTGDLGGGADHLPVSGGGPFAPLTSEPGDQIDAPLVLLDPTADLDDPDVLVDGDALTVFVTAKRKGAITIEQAHALSLRAGFGDQVPVLAADQPWEMGAVAAPSVLRGAPWLLFYAAGGAIGLATSSDGQTWEKRTSPVFTADADEGSELSAPAAVLVGDQVRLYYTATGSIWAAEAPLVALTSGDSVSWTRLDGEPATSPRDPMVAAGGAPFDRLASRWSGRLPARRSRRETVSATISRLPSTLE